MITREQIPQIVGHPVYDTEGRKIGPAKHLYLDDATGEPVWVTVRTGFFGGHETFVPTGSARIEEGRMRVPFPKSAVKGAPNVALDSEGHLSGEQERRLYGYYGLDAPGGSQPGETPAAPAGEPDPATRPGESGMSGSEAGVGTGQSAEDEWSGTCGPADRPRPGRPTGGTPPPTWPEEEMGPGTGVRPRDPE